MNYIFIFKDHWNPTKEEIFKWANDKDAGCDQDWELAVAVFENFDLMVVLANDISLDKRHFFLSCLYVFTGDIVRSANQIEINKLRTHIEGIEIENECNEIANWKKRSLQLIEDPKQYDYQYWGLGSKYV